MDTLSGGDMAHVDEVQTTPDQTETFCSAGLDQCCALPLFERHVDPDCTLWTTSPLGSLPALPAIDVKRGRIHVVYQTGVENSCVLHSFELADGHTVTVLPFACDRTLTPVVLPNGDVLAYSLPIFRFDANQRKVVWWKERTELPGPISASASVLSYDAAFVSDYTLIGIDARTGAKVASWSHPSKATLSSPLWQGTTLFLASSEGTFWRFPILEGGENTAVTLSGAGLPGNPVPWFGEKLIVLTESLSKVPNVHAIRTFGKFPELAGTVTVDDLDPFSEPTVTSSSVTIVRQNTGKTVLVSPVFGVQPFTPETTKITSATSVLPNSVVAGTETGIVAIQPVTGVVQWTYNTDAPVYQPPVPVGDGTAIVVTANARVLRISGMIEGLDSDSVWPKPRGDLANTGSTRIQ